jgi:heme-degrading monooxygenase HmoA
MHARVTTGTVRPERLDEFVRSLRESLVPAAERQQGYREFLLLTDRGSGRVVGLTLWETEQDLRASEEAAGYYREHLAKLAPFFASPPSRDAYEVALGG